MFSTTIHSTVSNHTLYVREIPSDQIAPLQLKDSDGYTQFYEVRNFDENGVVFMYLAKGLKESPKEIVAWYPNTGAFWSGFGTSIKKAIEGAQRDGWLYA